MRKASMVAVLVFALAGLCAIANAATTSWDGVDWGAAFGSIAVNSGSMMVTTGVNKTDNWGAAQYNTSALFRAAATPWIQATFIDNGSGAGASLWSEQESGTNKFWTQIGTYQGDSNYSIYWWNPTTNKEGTVVLGSRTAGSHTVKIGRNTDGTLDYYFDGQLKYTSGSEMLANYFGDVYLAAHSQGANQGTVAFTDYQSGIDYSPAPVPEPGTILAALTILGPAGIAFRRRRA